MKVTETKPKNEMKTMLMTFDREIPHPVIHKGTVARLAIQCTCPDTGEIGNFLFVAESPAQQGTRCSPVFQSLTAFFDAVKTSGWKPVGHSADTYLFEGRV